MMTLEELAFRVIRDQRRATIMEMWDGRQGLTIPKVTEAQIEAVLPWLQALCQYQRWELLTPLIEELDASPPPEVKAVLDRIEKEMKTLPVHRPAVFKEGLKITADPSAANADVRLRQVTRKFWEDQRENAEFLLNHEAADGRYVATFDDQADRWHVRFEMKGGDDAPPSTTGAGDSADSDEPESPLPEGPGAGDGGGESVGKGARPRGGRAAGASGKGKRRRK